mmetsp:Transcript_6900/g.12668  ORF Transcript_6900/g.12668 Transcript_6900/m.12668 type:complete len:1029 (+) Transcript_6900:181-3267(+)|eukprot:CAMPEP_0197532420 /NCGR_PEP_ID=MMETSP1318-20131121/39611_1 /TAXON_ID=552666 /ORGANISM="Partenskyella glossopodia, Strain RCC365" /LENGTH=1028 /DNA_ID=CAMNT_0043088967 /DNA_START=106 /DNA_END=3192 /DNA_ORIENTATION=+
MPKYTYEELALLDMHELRALARGLGLNLPQFGDMHQMIQDVIRAQNTAKPRKNTSSTSRNMEASSNYKLKGKIEAKGGRFSPSTRASRSGSSPNLSMKEIKINLGGGGAVPRLSPKPKKKKSRGSPKPSSRSPKRADMEQMSRTELLHYARQVGLADNTISRTTSVHRLISDILLYRKDPKGYVAQQRAMAKAKADALKARTGGGAIRTAKKRGVSVDVSHDFKETVESLKKVPILYKLRPDIIKTLAVNSKTRQTSEGEPVFLQGEEGDGFYLIKQGRADVIVGESTVVGTLGPGDYFGEGALINKAPRGATVRATEDLVCMFWTKIVFMEVFAKVYGSRALHTMFAKRENVLAETGDNQYVAPVEKKLYDKSDEDKANIRTWTKSSALLESITSDKHFDNILKGFFRKNYTKGQVVVREGDHCLMLYVVCSGTFQVSSKAEGDIHSLHRGDLIGELALLHDATSKETVTARTDGDLWCISRFTFRRLVQEVSEGELARRVEFLAQTDLCRALSSYERNNIAEALEEVVYKRGDVIMKQGDEGDCMYFLQSGDVTAYVDGSEITWKNKDLIGELALMTGRKRAATVKVVENDTKLFRLSKIAVETLLGPVKAFLEARAKKYNRHSIAFPLGESGMKVFGTKVIQVDPGMLGARLGVQVGWQIVEVNGRAVQSYEDWHKYIDRTKKTNTLVFSGLGKKRVAQVECKKRPAFLYKIADLEKLCILGKGSFGSVYLTKTRNGDTYALKCVSKRIVLETKQAKHIVSEKQVMEKMDHPFIIKLFSTYKDTKCVYFVLELCLGGELFGLIQNRGGALSEKATRFYSANIVSIFSYMHSMDIIYRDLKPENLLVDAQGYLKLVDFGFAKQISKKTFTLCGTPDYLAPEIIRGTGHGKGVDWWCLGIFTYELVSSYAPFYADSPKQTYKMICSKAPITYPPNFSKPLRNLLDGLLRRKPSDRLGVIQGGAKRIKDHPWFESINWEKLIQKKISPPFIVPIKSSTDATNFDDYSDDEEPYDCGKRPTGSWEQYFG